ncbi:MAG: TRAP transporter substrate-binding protein DctP [Oscillospiraceae bacterium]|nr:TRAP transporter substrate-binding protein DctP [Oscillospiraceae bacterium]
MKMLKKSMALVLVLIMVFSLAACGAPADTTTPPADSGTTTPPASSTPSAPPADSGESEMTAEEVKAIVEEVAANSTWDDMAIESGIVETIDKIVTVEKDYTLRLGTPTGGRQDANYFMALFEAYIEASTAGKVQVENYPVSQLGTNPQMLEGVLDGSISAWVGPIDYLYNYAPAVGVTAIPFFFNDGSYQAVRIFNEDPTMDNYLNSKGFYPLAWLYDNSTTLLSAKEINSISDFKGMSIWCLPTEMGQKMISALGASPVLLDSSDVSVAFQNGTIDAGVAGMTFFNTFKVQESAEYIYNFPFVAAPIVVAFSVEFMDSLPEDLRALIDYAGDMIVNDYQKAFDEGFLKTSEASVLESVEFQPVSDEMVAEAEALCADIAEFYKSGSKENAEMYEAMAALIEADNAAGGGRGIW